MSLRWTALFSVCLLPTVSLGADDGSPAMKLIEARRVLIIAHRGDSSAFPENTLPAFRSAVQLGADLVELDYHHSEDGVPIVLHDKKLDRTTNAANVLGRGGVLVTDLRSADLKQLDAGRWFDARFADTRLPTLKESLRVIQAGSVTLIERKGGDAATCVDLLRTLGLLDRVVVQSFDWDYVRDCHRLAPTLALAVLGSDPLSSDKLDLAVKSGARIVGWNHERIGRKEIQSIHARGLKVWVYTVDDVTRARQLIADGIDGIITNVPGRMLNLAR